MITRRQSGKLKAFIQGLQLQSLTASRLVKTPYLSLVKALALQLQDVTWTNLNQCLLSLKLEGVWNNMPKLPDEQWKESFRTYSMKRTFNLGLSQAMIEMLCAAADDTTWDRSAYPNIHAPDNWYSTEKSLEKRGLVERKPSEVTSKIFRKKTGKDTTVESRMEETYIQLTPAGKALVELFRVTGIFIQSDAGIRKKARGA